MQKKRNRYNKTNKQKKNITTCDCVTRCCHHCDNMRIGLIDSSVNIAGTKKCIEAKLYSTDVWRVKGAEMGLDWFI